MNAPRYRTQWHREETSLVSVSAAGDQLIPAGFTSHRSFAFLLCFSYFVTATDLPTQEVLNDVMQERSALTLNI